MCVELDGENGVEWDHAWVVNISEIFFFKKVCNIHYTSSSLKTFLEYYYSFQMIKIHFKFYKK